MRLPLLDRADTIARELTMKPGNEYPYLSRGDQGVALALLEKIQRLEREVKALVATSRLDAE